MQWLIGAAALTLMGIPDLENCHSVALHWPGESVMAAKALVQTRIDVDVKEQATQVLENMGLTVSDAVRILLTRTAKEGRCQSNS